MRRTSVSKNYLPLASSWLWNQSGTEGEPYQICVLESVNRPYLHHPQSDSI